MTQSQLGRRLDVQKSLRCVTSCHLQSQWTWIALTQLAIEALSTVHATDFKAGEVEIGIVSISEDEDAKTRGIWRSLNENELDEHLSAYAEKD